MIVEGAQENYTNSKYYYQFYNVATILEHVIDCFQTIVSDETNPYHPPLSWLTRKQLKPPGEELFLDLFEECSSPKLDLTADNDGELSLSVKTRLEKCSQKLRLNIVSRIKEGCSPLFMACKLGHYKITKYLLEACQADIEQKGRYEALEDHHIHSVSPIWVAAVSGNLDIVQLLIDHRADINSTSDTGSTPLRSVCFLCKDDDTSFHQQQQDRHQQQLNDEPPSTQPDRVHKPELDVFVQIVKLLVENGADLSKPNYNGGTCLINSIHNYELTQFILERGVDVNARDHQSKTALHYAIQQNRLEVVKLLLNFGADPTLSANFCDDALQLACLGGHLDIFEHLIKTTKYTERRLTDAYKLLGSSILELHYDLSRVRELWEMALEINVSTSSTNGADQDIDSNQELSINVCDKWRHGAFSDTMEFSSLLELQSLTADDFRIQSLLISERVLGLNHRETIQRLFHRGTFYLNSLRPDRCIDLWIYAFKLRLQYESIFHFESIFAAQAITKLFLDLISQQQEVKFLKVLDLLSLLVDQLDESYRHLSNQPVSRLHEDIFDLLLGIMMNLLIALNHEAKEPNEIQLARQFITRLIRICPRTSNGSTLLHVCVAPGAFDTEAYKLIRSRSGDVGISPMVELIFQLIDNGLAVDLTNHDGLSALQVLCTTSLRTTDKRAILRRLVDKGAHVDRRPLTPEQGEIIRQSLKEAGVNLTRHVTLSCLAARKLAESKIQFDENMLTRPLREFIAVH